MNSHELDIDSTTRIECRASKTAGCRFDSCPICHTNSSGFPACGRYFGAPETLTHHPPTLTVPEEAQSFC